MDNDLMMAWCAGFIEGDGTFDPRQRWRATSTETVHLDRLVETFGGRWYKVSPQPLPQNWRNYYEWSVSTKRSGTPSISSILPGLSAERVKRLVTCGFVLPEKSFVYSDEEWLAWLAGFIDAEGHVCGTGPSLSTNLILAQVASDETLLNAQRIVGGGSVNWYPNNWRGSYRYGVYGAKADAALLRLMPYLCAPRQNQIHRHWMAQAERRSATVDPQPRTPRRSTPLATGLQI